MMYTRHWNGYDVDVQLEINLSAHVIIRSKHLEGMRITKQQRELLYWYNLIYAAGNKSLLLMQV